MYFVMYVIYGGIHKPAYVCDHHIIYNITVGGITVFNIICLRKLFINPFMPVIII